VGLLPAAVFHAVLGAGFDAGFLAGLDAFGRRHAGGEQGADQEKEGAVEDGFHNAGRSIGEGRIRDYAEFAESSAGGGLQESVAGGASLAQRKPTWLLPVSGGVPRRAEGR